MGRRQTIHKHFERRQFRPDETAMVHQAHQCLPLVVEPHSSPDSRTVLRFGPLDFQLNDGPGRLGGISAIQVTVRSEPHFADDDGTDLTVILTAIRDNPDHGHRWLHLASWLWDNDRDDEAAAVQVFWPTLRDNVTVAGVPLRANRRGRAVKATLATVRGPAYGGEKCLLLSRRRNAMWRRLLVLVGLVAAAG